MAPLHQQFLLWRLARSWQRINMSTISCSVHLRKLVSSSLRGSLTSMVIWRTAKVVSHSMPATARDTVTIFSILGSPVLQLFLLSFLLSFVVVVVVVAVAGAGAVAAPVCCSLCFAWRLAFFVFPWLVLLCLGLLTCQLARTRACSSRYCWWCWGTKMEQNTWNTWRHTSVAV